jgi:hypothetical protein
MNSHRFVCVDCGQEKIHVNPNGCGGTGYATYQMDGVEKKVCYACCAKRELEYMRDTGRAVLYLTDGPEGSVVTDWPGVLRFRVQHKRVGSHNVAGRRVDVWFVDSDGREWHGVNYGHNSQLCHCRRLRGAA